MSCQNPTCENAAAIKFCSRSCAAVVNNKISPKRSVKRVCSLETCDKLVPLSSTKYCTKDHWQQHLLEISVRLALETGQMPVSSVACKRVLRQVRGWKCELSDCGITVWNGQEVPLILDHIDGHSENHIYSNLRLVCGNCDMLLPTYKARNIGNGRHARRQRYASGQSY